MPQLGLTMEAGKVLGIFKGEGERVEKGDLLLEIETEKTSVVVEAPASGYVREIRARPGEIYPVGTVLLCITDGPDEPFAGDWCASPPSGGLGP